MDNLWHSSMIISPSLWPNWGIYPSVVCPSLLWGLRGLPEFLVANPGLNSGFMISQYAAASMVSQNKMYYYPASSDSIVSSNGQEDHVSMGANAAIKLFKIMDNLEHILATN